ncbi:caspase family protein [Bradyrhizobium japonicum]|uniref:caspase family protein n=1 Tax=Bradyrhizobium japonicum TaxID=375 RepID=UPI00289B32FC|nr:caspase family protein [Bradyrhizobium japonicum]
MIPAGRRVALVVGNASYRHMPSLTNPRNDAADVEGALKGLGFETILATDLDRGGMSNAMERFSRLVPGAGVAMVYYSGHGMQFEGRNYLLPVDASLESAADVNRFRLMPLDDLVDVLRSGSGLQLIVLDACRNNPIERDFKNKVASLPGGTRDAGSTRGFARIDARSGLIITYATAPDSVASDGNGRNSPFTQAFLKNIGAPDVDVRQMLFRVQSDVYTASGSKQLPEISSLYVGPEIRLKSGSR